MSHARIVVAQGVIDGSNRTFSTGVPYVAGTTAYILNGRVHSYLVLNTAFSYTESNPDGGQILVDVPPIDGDIVQIFFWDKLAACRVPGHAPRKRRL